MNLLFRALQREWKISLFLLGPVFGVYLVNLIFGMPTFLLWTGLGIFILSLLVMWSIIKQEIRRLKHERIVPDQHATPPA